jgi:hypothetical protein
LLVRLYFIVSQDKIYHCHLLEAHISHLFLYFRNYTCFGLSVEELLMLDTSACFVIEVVPICSLY